MPSLTDHQSNEFTKLLIMGDSKSGKTGSLASLVQAGYKLRILDLDNGLDVLKQFVLRDCPDKLGTIEYRTLRDKRKATREGFVVLGQPKAYMDAASMLVRWKYDDVDLGDPSEWGPDCVLVVDSLTLLSDAAFDHFEPLTPRGKGGGYDPRITYRNAQGSIVQFLSTITGAGFETNVIVLSHIKYDENPDGSKKGYPNSVGAALSPKIPMYFNNVVKFTTKSGGRRVIETVSSEMFDLANAKPFEMERSLNIETGLAEIFKTLRPIKQTQTLKIRRI